LIPTDVIEATDGVMSGMARYAFFTDFENCYHYSMVLVKHAARSLKYSFIDPF